jgi:excisionase family DNA binding protein
MDNNFRLEQKVDRILTLLESNQIEQLLDTAALCNYLKISKRTIFNYIDQGKIKAHKISGKLFFKKSEIDVAIFGATQ